MEEQSESKYQFLLYFKLVEWIYISQICQLRETEKKGAMYALWKYQGSSDRRCDTENPQTI